MRRRLRALVLAALAAVAPQAARAQWDTVPPDAVMPDWRNTTPRIVHPDSSLVRLYDNAWETAAGRVRRGPEGMAASPYLDENCYDDQIWIWDGCFMAHFSKYAPEAFPGMETLMNYYAPIHDGAPSPLRIHWCDNPPLFAWTEFEHQRFTGVPARLDYLKKHYAYFNALEYGERDERVSPNAVSLTVLRDSLGRADGYCWKGNGSGMDNTPRGRGCGGWGGIRWVDAISQQALSALYISRLETDPDSIAAWRAEYERLKEIVNRDYWDEEDGFYYDIDINTGKPCKVITIASFWPMMAEIPDSLRAERMVEKLRSPNHFGGRRPWPSVSRSDADFDSLTGNYWRGGIWLPTAYMGTKAVEKYGYTALADSVARNIVELQARVFENFPPATIWETYSPVADEPSTEHGHLVRKEFCGWSALGPISMTIENLLGFRGADASTRTLTWDIKPENGTHGIRKFKFFGVTADLIYNADGGMAEVTSDAPFTLMANGRGYSVKPGTNKFRIQ